MVCLISIFEVFMSSYKALKKVDEICNHPVALQIIYPIRFTFVITVLVSEDVFSVLE